LRAPSKLRKARLQSDRCRLTNGFERASVERILRGGEVIEPARDVMLKAGDIVGLAENWDPSWPLVN